MNDWMLVWVAWIKRVEFIQPVWQPVVSCKRGDRHWLRRKLLTLFQSTEASSLAPISRSLLRSCPVFQLRVWTETVTISKIRNFISVHFAHHQLTFSPLFVVKIVSLGVKQCKRHSAIFCVQKLLPKWRACITPNSIRTYAIQLANQLARL